ncbi:MAG TPA: hypothetical protein VHG89_00930 [Verrucomicrobiae bacterium]|nr:hypothetical protein [Verrucomicrobiae bacterium]
MVLKTPEGNPLSLANVLIKIQTFATYRNSISLFPFATNHEGIARITNEEMRAEVSATYDSGLMDYSAIESAHESVEILLASQTEIEKAVSARINVWKRLLRGEKERWKTIGDLVSLYKSSTNHLLEIPDDLPARPKIRDSWIRPDAEYNYEIRVRRK